MSSERKQRPRADEKIVKLHAANDATGLKPEGRITTVTVTIDTESAPVGSFITRNGKIRVPKAPRLRNLYEGRLGQIEEITRRRYVNTGDTAMRAAHLEAVRIHAILRTLTNKDLRQEMKYSLEGILSQGAPMQPVENPGEEPEQIDILLTAAADLALRLDPVEKPHFTFLVR